MLTIRALATHLAAASLAGVIAGCLVAGLLGRIAMRVSGALSRPDLIGVETSNGNRVGEITLGGTLGLALFVGLSAGVVGGLLFASAEPWLRRYRPRHGLLFGLALLGGIGFTFIDPANFDFQRFGLTPLNVVMFAALFIAFGVLVAWLFDWIRASMSGSGTTAKVVSIIAWLAAVLAAIGAVGAIASLGGAENVLPGLLFGAALVIPAVVRWRSLPPAIAYAAFALPLVAGALRTLTGISQMLD